MAARLDGTVVLVSGGARGLGAAHARGVVAEGAAEAQFGDLDVLVNNAGVTDRDIKGIVEMTLDEYMRVVMVNQVGVFLGMHVGAMPIIRRSGGSIVNISSVAGLLGAPGGANYTASK